MWGRVCCLCLKQTHRGPPSSFLLRVRQSHTGPPSSFLASLFRGQVDKRQVLPYPGTLDQEEKEMIGLLLPVAERVISEQNDPLLNDSLGLVPENTLEALKEVGGLGLQAPVEYGGVGLNNSQYGRISEVLGGHDLGLGVFLTGHQGIGYKGIVLFGTEEQKAQYLPDLASGNKMAAFALTEPGSGSDASSISTRAERSQCGKFWILTGSKLWITGGGLADVFTVFAKTELTDVDTGTTRDKVTAFFVERDFGGVTHGLPEEKMGIKCSNTAEVFFDQTRVPIENVIGGEGNGFKVAMQILNNGRFGMGTSLSGMMRSIIEKVAEHVKTRSQFGSKLSQFEGVQEKVARMSVLHYATESLAYMVSGTMDQGHKDYQLEAAVSKVFSSEAAWIVTDEAIQLLGGMGYMRDTGLEKMQRDLRIFRIFEGTNDILRLFVALTGLQEAGKGLKELQGMAKRPLSNLPNLMGELGCRMQARVGLGLEDLSGDLHPSLSHLAQPLSREMTRFSVEVERLLMTHGKKVVEQQFRLNRLADSAIDIYVSVSVLSRCSQSLDLGLESGEQEQLLASLWCREAMVRIRDRLGQMEDRQGKFQDMADISQAMSRAGGVVQGHPVGV